MAASGAFQKLVGENGLPGHGAEVTAAGVAAQGADLFPGGDPDVTSADIVATLTPVTAMGFPSRTAWVGSGDAHCARAAVSALDGAMAAHRRATRQPRRVCRALELMWSRDAAD